MTIETVYSPIDDRNIRTNLCNSPIWKDAYKAEEIDLFPNKQMYAYKIKFNGTIPIQVLKTEIL